MDDIRISFPGGRRVNAELAGRIIETDQSPAHGGEGAAPEPFELFLASLATCAGLYAHAFCTARNLSTEGLSLVQRHRMSEDGKRLAHVSLELTLPAGFPEKYRAAIANAAASCKVKKVLAAPPDFDVSVVDAAKAA